MFNLFSVPISITSKSQALALVGEWLREYRSVIGSRLSVARFVGTSARRVSSKSAGFQSAGPKPINRKQTNLKQKTENRKPITGYPKIIVTPNPEMIVAAQTDPEFLKALQPADLAIPDGIGIVWALKLLGSRFSVIGFQSQVNRFSVNRSKTGKPKTDRPETENRKQKTENWPLSRLSGLDLMESLIGESAKKGWKVMLLGGKPEVAEKAAEKLQLSVLSYQFSDSSQPVIGLSVAETDEQKTGKPETDPPALAFGASRWRARNRKQKTDNRLQIKSISGSKDISNISKSENDRLISEINSFFPDLLFVAFGHGKQEKWLTKNRHRLNVGVAMGVGGAFDQIADPSLRPPAYINSIGLGWLYRLIRQPWRWKRQLALARFGLMVFRQKLQFSSSELQ